MEKSECNTIIQIGEKDDENYRPIGVTPLICKVLEKIIRNAIVHYLEFDKIISDNQHGFRKGKSCITQLLECIEDWMTFLAFFRDEGENTLKESLTQSGF